MNFFNNPYLNELKLFPLASASPITSYKYCKVCKVEFVDNEFLFRIAGCGHRFCKHCLKNWALVEISSGSRKWNQWFPRFSMVKLHDLQSFFFIFFLIVAIADSVSFSSDNSISIEAPNAVSEIIDNNILWHANYSANFKIKKIIRKFRTLTCKGIRSDGRNWIFI